MAKVGWANSNWNTAVFFWPNHTFLTQKHDILKEFLIYSWVETKFCNFYLKKIATCLTGQ